MQCLGEDPSREGLLKTPMRMAKALLACTAGYAESAKDIVSDALFECESREVRRRGAFESLSHSFAC